MTAMVIPQKQQKVNPVRLWLTLLMVAIVAIGAVGLVALPTAAYAQCTNGVDGDGNPCLDIQADSLMTAIFRWANVIIPVLLPLVAIGIGIQFGGNILSSIKNFFGSFRLG